MDPLQLRADFDHAQALANAKELAAAIRDLKDVSQSAGASFGQLNPQIATAGTNTVNLNQNTNTLNLSYQTLNQQFNQFNQQVNVATQNTANFNQNTQNTVQNINNITNVTKQASSATGSLVSQVTSLVTAYFGLRGVINLLHELIDQLNKVREAQNQLTDSKFLDDRSLVSLMANLGVQGQAGESHARKLRNDLAVKSGSSLSRASDALEVTNASGIDVNTSGGNDFAAQLAMLAERRDLDRESLLQFARGAKQRGITTAGGLKGLIAKGDAVFSKSLGIDPADFWRGATSAVGPEVPKGVDPDLALAMYSSFVGQDRSERFAAQHVREVVNLAQGTNSKARAFLASQASSMGLLNVAAVSDADVEAALGQTKEGKSILSGRRHITDEEGRLALDDDEFKRRMYKLRHSAHGLADINFAQREHDEHVRSTRAKLEADRADVATRFEAARKQLMGQRLDAAFQGMPIQDRLTKLLLPIASSMSGNQDAQNAFIQQLGGDIDSATALFMLGNGPGLNQLNIALAAQRGARGKDTDTTNAAFASTSAGRQTRTETEQAILNQNAVNNPGDTFNALLDKQATEQAKRDLAAHKFTPTVGGFLSHPIGSIYDAVSSDRQLAQTKQRMLQQQMQDYLSTVPAGSPEASQVRALLGEMADFDGSLGANVSTSIALDRLGTIARDFGSITGSSSARPTTRPSAAPSPPPTTRPTTQPSPQASAIHYHIGNYWAGGDDDFDDLPGRLERLS